jgi:transcriptional regulator GlxA family with amidase domain
VPGGGWNNHAPEGSWAEAQRGELPRALQERADGTRWIASVCTGAMLLATAGLLDGRYATTNRNAFDELRPHVLDVVAERVVDHGDRITAGGLTAGLDLGIWIIERELGTAAADERCNGMEYQRQGRVWIAPLL